MDVVVTRFEESIEWTKTLPYNVVIYNKGLPHIQKNVTQLVNFGREADGMLYHIIKNYDCLSDTTAFLQADPFDHCWNVLQLLDKHQHATDVIWLGSNWGPVTKRFDGGPGNGCALPLLEMCNELFPSLTFDVDTVFTFSAGAQYIVPKKYILSKSLDWWINTHKLFKDRFCLINTGHKNSAPWIFERIWPLIWNYSTNH